MSLIFRDRVMTELIYFQIFAIMFSVMSHRLMWTNFCYYILAIRLCHVWVPISVVISTLCFSSLSKFRQLHIPNAQRKYYEILTTNTAGETPHNTTRKIANRYVELNYQLSTLKKTFPITFEQGCTRTKRVNLSGVVTGIFPTNCNNDMGTNTLVPCIISTKAALVQTL